MTVNDKIISALEGIAPVYPDYFPDLRGTSYIVFSYMTRGALHSDDEPLFERYLVSVHYFAPRATNSVDTRKAIKMRLFAAGFTWPDEINASDSDGQHFVFECEIEEETDLDGETYL